MALKELYLCVNIFNGYYDDMKIYEIIVKN
jgi:hypothetical protein